jgi:hypothetical protein
VLLEEQDDDGERVGRASLVRAAPACDKLEAVYCSSFSLGTGKVERRGTTYGLVSTGLLNDTGVKVRIVYRARTGIVVYWNSGAAQFGVL